MHLRPVLLRLVERLEQLLDVLQGLSNPLREPLCLRGGTTLLRRHVEEDHVLARNDVRHSVAIVGHRTEATACTDEIRVLGRVQLVRLTVRRLTGGQSPGLTEHLLQEGRVHLQVLGHDKQTEQVTIDALAAHRILVATLVLQASGLQQFHALGGLRKKKRKK